MTIYQYDYLLVVIVSLYKNKTKRVKGQTINNTISYIRRQKGGQKNKNISSLTSKNAKYRYNMGRKTFLRWFTYQYTIEVNLWWECSFCLFFTSATRKYQWHAYTRKYLIVIAMLIHSDSCCRSFTKLTSSTGCNCFLLALAFEAKDIMAYILGAYSWIWMQFLVDEYISIFFLSSSSSSSSSRFKIVITSLASNLLSSRKKKRSNLLEV